MSRGHGCRVLYLCFVEGTAIEGVSNGERSNVFEQEMSGRTTAI